MKLKNTPLVLLACFYFSNTITLSYAQEQTPSPSADTPLSENLSQLGLIETALLDSPIAETDTDRAEASLYLARNLAHYLRTDVIHVDPRQPQLLTSPGYGFPNPDNLYVGVQLDPEGVYRVWGQLGTVNRTIFGVYSPQALEGETGGGARLLGSELETDKHGNFELFVSVKKMGVNWLPMTENTQSMTIYQIYSDWEKERKGKLMIERLDTMGTASQPLSTAQFKQRVAGLDEKMAWFLNIWRGITQRYHGGIPDNSILPPRRIQVTYRGGQFSPGHWRLKDDEALIIEFEDPKTSYWGFSFYQPWGELLDIAGRQSSLNSSQAHRDSDGKFRLVVTANDPGVANWIDISGHPHGVFNWRVTSDTAPKKAQTKTVPVSELADHLPTNTRYVSTQERADQLRKRRQHMARRMSP